MPAVEDVGHQEPAECLEVGSIGQRKPLLHQALDLFERGGRFVQQSAREEQIAFRRVAALSGSTSRICAIDPGQSPSWASDLAEIEPGLEARRVVGDFRCVRGTRLLRPALLLVEDAEIELRAGKSRMTGAGRSLRASAARAGTASPRSGTPPGSVGSASASVGSPRPSRGTAAPSPARAGRCRRRRAACRPGCCDRRATASACRA